jgi:hypothetical protein
MQSRRTILGLAGSAALGAVPLGWAATAALPKDAPADTPKATVIAGKPPILDFGDGVRVPCDKSAFLTLWEGPHYWLTFGAGRSHYAEQAQGQAVKYAKSAMKLLLMTLAFAPDRLAPIEGHGWRLRSRDIKDFVKGDLELPGNPFWPGTDAFMGFATSDAPALGSLGFGAQSSSGTTGGTDLLTGSWIYVDAFSAYVIFKRDVTLAWVRQHAQVLPTG